MDVIKEPKYSDHDDQYEHVEEGLRIDLDEVVSDEEGKQVPKDGKMSGFDAHYDVETSYREPEDEKHKEHDDKEMN